MPIVTTAQTATTADIEVIEELLRFESIPVEPPHPRGGWNVSPEKRHETIQGYFTAVTAMDNAIGRVLQKLQDLGIRKDTIIVFLSDNGMNTGHHGICGKGNGTFPMNMYDTSVKVPFIVSCPDRIPQGVVNYGLYSQYDFMPTILDYLNFGNSEAGKLPGRSFANVLRSKEDKGSENIVVFDEYGPVRMIRNSEWKYVYRYPYGPHELYWLEKDPSERNNLIEDAQYDQIVTELRRQLDDWFCKYSTPELGGVRQAVKGKGQIDMVEAGGKGRKSFV